MRRRYIPLIVLGLIVFVAISGLLARALSLPNAEQSAVTALVSAEAGGNGAAVAAKLDGCARSERCRAAAAAQARALARPGRVAVVNYIESAGFSFTTTTGIARVAWVAGNSRPIVQCVEVRRAGSLFTGQRIELLGISPRIFSDESCPSALPAGSVSALRGAGSV